MQDSFEERFARDRRHTNCVKWDASGLCGSSEDPISMWIADMDFQSPPSVLEALRARVDHGVFGYHMPPESYFEAFMEWERERHGYEVRREWLRFSPGVVSSVYWFVHMMTDPGDACILLTPVYYPFHNAVKDTGRRLVCSDLVCENGVYTIDFERFEADILENRVKLFILCSPHNPVGRVWTRIELETLLGICEKHGVFVVSDEIHQDIVLGDKKHIPAATLGDSGGMPVTLASASKSFNLAGCSNSFVVIPGEETRAKFDGYVRSHAPGGGSLFGFVAAEAAYRGGAEWLDEVLRIVRWNDGYIREAFARALPGVVASPLEGTYLGWYDFSAYVPPGELEGFMKEKCNIAVDYGDWFGSAGAGHVRLNLATPRKYAVEAAGRIVSRIKGRA